MDAGTVHVKTPGGLKRLKWCVDNWGFVSKEVPYSKKFSRVQIFAEWLESPQKNFSRL